MHTCDASRWACSGARSTCPLAVATNSMSSSATGVSRGSQEKAATTFSPSLKPKNFWIGSPKPEVAGTSLIRIT